MDFGIVGLPFVGKTTLFNALTRAGAAIGTYDAASKDPNRATVRVADPRVERLTECFHSRKVTPAAINYVDVAGMPAGAVSSGRLSPELLGALRTTDALVHVVRGFRDEHVPHHTPTLDPLKDVDTLEVEFALADLQIVENRLDRLGREMRAGKDPATRREHDLLERIRAIIEAGTPLRGEPFDDEEEFLIRGYQFLSQKPMLVVLNLDERDLGRPDALTLLEDWAGGAQARVVGICASMEMELAAMDDAEAASFREDLCLDPEPAIVRVVQESYALLDVITFLTSEENETRAWTIRAGSTALQAAGAIHSDLERGFICAEVVPWEDLVSCGSYGKAREAARLRLEGKQYLVQDGDVIFIRFNV